MMMMMIEKSKKYNESAASGTEIRWAKHRKETERTLQIVKKNNNSIFFVDSGETENFISSLFVCHIFLLSLIMMLFSSSVPAFFENFLFLSPPPLFWFSQ